MNTLLKFISYGALGVLLLILVTATFLERLFGSSIVLQYLYTSPWIIALWVILTVSALAHITLSSRKKLSCSFLIHISFAVILSGALVTHIFGKQGRMHLFEGAPPTDRYICPDGTIGNTPFRVSLESFELKYYRGTYAPMDYISTILLSDNEKSTRGIVSTNSTFAYRGWSFHQSGYDKEHKSTTLLITHDPYGTGITFAGYIMLLLSLVGFFFQKNSTLRTLLKSPLLRRTNIVLLFLLLAPTLSAAPKSLPADVSEKFGNLYVYYNGRVCPMQTLAREFTSKLYGKTTYKGLSAEQVLIGWLFYYDEWREEPMIAIKGGRLKKILGISGKYAAISDFTDTRGYKLSDILEGSIDKPLRRAAESANEKFNLVSMLCNGNIMRMFPISNGEESTRWHSLAFSLPEVQTTESFAKMRSTMKSFSEAIFSERYHDAAMLLNELRRMQIAEATASALPDERHFAIEKCYNSMDITKWLAILFTIFGVASFILYTRNIISDDTKWPIIHKLLTTFATATLIYLLFYVALRGYIGNHLPLSNGYETMLFMAIVSLLLTLLIRHKFYMALPFGLLISGISLAVATMGSNNPQITHLMPELHSPLLSFHVVFTMLAYALFAFAMLNSITALLLMRSPKSSRKVEYLTLTGKIILYPAEFLLIIGIFIGAVWANTTWGRYWGWSPKEVWSLITMLVYSLGIHSNNLPFLRNSLYFHIFCIVSFATVLITYFGVNFFFGGIHSYI